jgi:hypothetical protein
VTWGVCRADVRSAIEPGDWIVFFSLQQDDSTRTTVYRFAAALCVEEKVAHTELFGGPFAKYLNLLIRPSGAGWERHEPGLHYRRWHDDWLWRICRAQGLDKSAVTAASEGHRPGLPLPIPAARNYVIFSKDSAVVACSPRVVAVHHRGEAAETWLDEPGPQAVRSAVFGDSPRALRIANPQRAHRHFRRHLEDPTWPAALRGALALMESLDGVASRLQGIPSPGRIKSQRQ